MQINKSKRKERVNGFEALPSLPSSEVILREDQPIKKIRSKERIKPNQNTEISNSNQNSFNKNQCYISSKIANALQLLQKNQSSQNQLIDSSQQYQQLSRQSYKPTQSLKIKYYENNLSNQYDTNRDNSLKQDQQQESSQRYFTSQSRNNLDSFGLNSIILSPRILNSKVTDQQPILKNQQTFKQKLANNQYQTSQGKVKNLPLIGDIFKQYSDNNSNNKTLKLRTANLSQRSRALPESQRDFSNSFISGSGVITGEEGKQKSTFSKCLTSSQRKQLKRKDLVEAVKEYQMKLDFNSTHNLYDNNKYMAVAFTIKPLNQSNL